MSKLKTLAASGLIVLTMAGTMAATTEDADAHGWLVPGLIIGTIGGLIIGSTIAHPTHVYYRAGCHEGWRRGWWGRWHRVEICR
jgi:uncharacterized membrane protein YeiH